MNFIIFLCVTLKLFSFSFVGVPSRTKSWRRRCMGSTKIIHLTIALTRHLSSCLFSLPLVLFCLSYYLPSLANKRHHLALITLERAVIEDVVILGLAVSVFIPPLALIHWFSGRLTGCQLLQLIQLGITIVFSATGFHFFLWQVNYLSPR